MKECSFLAYRLEVVRTMPDGDFKTALVESIRARMARLASTYRSAG